MTDRRASVPFADVNSGGMHESVVSPDPGQLLENSQQLFKDTSSLDSWAKPSGEVSGDGLETVIQDCHRLT